MKVHGEKTSNINGKEIVENDPDESSSPSSNIHIRKDGSQILWLNVSSLYCLNKELTFNRR